MGAHRDDDNGIDSGSAYLFDTTTGEQIAKLLPDDGAPGVWFGFSVAISGDIAIVGAPRDDDNGRGSGSAYLFNITTGEQLFKLLPSDGAESDDFGYCVAVSGDVAIVGAPGDYRDGSAYLFDVKTGEQLFKLLPSDPAAWYYFGRSVAISGAIAIVGAVGCFDPMECYSLTVGDAYVFDVNTGEQLFKLLPNDGAEQHDFGFSVAISGTTAVVGARMHERSGSAYLFDVTTGQQLFKLLASDGADWDRFGISVAISGDIAIVGAFNHDDNGSGSGSAYLFDVTTGEQLSKLLASDGAENDDFGRCVAVSGDVAVVGAPDHYDNGSASGAAYIFDLNCGCAADFNGDGIVNTLDFIVYLNAYNVGDPRADMNGDGIVNTLDFLVFLNAYSKGC